MVMDRKLTLEVLDFEDARTTFCSSSLQLRRVDLDKAVRIEVFAEQLADGGLKAEDSLVRGCLK